MGRDLQSLKQTTDMKASNTVSRSVQSEATVPRRAQDTHPPSLKRFMGKPFGEDGVKITHRVDWGARKVITAARSDMGTVTLTTATDNVSITMSSQQVVLTLGELKTIVADLEKLLLILDGDEIMDTVEREGKILAL